jgi:hypothetical protein
MKRLEWVVYTLGLPLPLLLLVALGSHLPARGNRQCVGRQLETTYMAREDACTAQSTYVVVFIRTAIRITKQPCATSWHIR